METWLNLPWSCGCHCGDELTQRGHCENSYDDEVPMRFVEDLEELTNVDVFLEKMVNRCALPPGSHLTVLVAGEGSRSSMLCNLMAGCKKEGEKVFDHQRGQKVQCWEAADGALRLMEMNLAQLEVPDSERRSQASNALEDLLLGAHRGINVMLYVVPFWSGIRGGHTKAHLPHAVPFEQRDFAAFSRGGHRRAIESSAK